MTCRSPPGHCENPFMRLCPAPVVRADATPDAHRRISSWSRKSPSGACITRAVARSSHRSSWRSSRPANSRCPRAPTATPSAVNLGQLVHRHRRIPEGATGEQPQRHRREHLPMPLDQVSRRGQPAPHVHRTADHRGVVAGDLAGLRRVPQVDDRAGDVATQHVGDLRGDLRGRPVPGRARDQDLRHLSPSGRALRVYCSSGGTRGVGRCCAGRRPGPSR